MAHRIGGRKLGRKMGPRKALFKNLTVSILRYERVQTTEAKAKEIRGRVERMISIAKQNDLAARRAIVAAFPIQPGVRTVQGELETALAKLGDGQRQPVDGAGRTDAGVHAIGQVIA